MRRCHQRKRARREAGRGGMLRELAGRRGVGTQPLEEAPGDREAQAAPCHGGAVFRGADTDCGVVGEAVRPRRRAAARQGVSRQARLPRHRRRHWARRRVRRRRRRVEADVLGGVRRMGRASQVRGEDGQRAGDRAVRGEGRFVGDVLRRTPRSSSTSRQVEGLRCTTRSTRPSV